MSPKIELFSFWKARCPNLKDAIKSLKSGHETLISQKYETPKKENKNDEFCLEGD